MKVTWKYIDGSHGYTKHALEPGGSWLALCGRRPKVTYKIKHPRWDCNEEVLEALAKCKRCVALIPQYNLTDPDTEATPPPAEADLAVE